MNIRFLKGSQFKRMAYFNAIVHYGLPIIGLAVFVVLWILGYL